MPIDPVALTAELIRFDTINPPGNEAACIAHLAALLTHAGFNCETIDLAPGRPNLVAKIGGVAGRPPIAFTGHVDTVPLGGASWSVAPHGAEIRDGRIWGRGASDMKSGVAAFTAAAIACAGHCASTPGVILYITVGEETGCDGAFAMTKRGIAGEAGVLVVAEPTSNRAFAGHKGALWLEARTTGVTAHGSMPHKGVNAVYRAARAISVLEPFDFNVARHPIMGTPTLNVGYMRGGINVNSVPDAAAIGIDIRTVPGMDHGRLRDQIASLLGPDVAIATLVDCAGVWTDPEHPWMQAVYRTVTDVEGFPRAVEAAPYFTDASVLTPALGNVPTVILGPGPAELAHQTDEWCEIARITAATEIYRRLIADWCGFRID